jgi:hypothetical protein
MRDRGYYSSRRRQFSLGLKILGIPNILLGSYYSRESPESREDYDARMKRRREEQAAARQRMAQAEATRKARQERERQQGMSFRIDPKHCLNILLIRERRGGRTTKEESRRKKGQSRS